MKVFIIHGWTYNLDHWQEFCDQLRSQGIEPVQLHVPGLTAESNQAWDIAGYVDWLKQQLAGNEQPIVIGHSNGGRIALAFVNRYPGVIKQLILIDSAGIYHGDIVSKFKRGTFKVLAKVGKPLTHVPVAKKVFYKLIGAKDYYRAPENMKQTMRNMLAADRNLQLDKIDVPVQLIWGRGDKSTPLADAHKFEQSLPNAQLEIIDGAGHSPHSSHTDQVVAIVLKTLKGLK